MDKQEFLKKLKETLQSDNELNMDTILDDLEEWDSLGMMTTAVFLEKEFGFKTTVNDLIAYQTVQELYNKVQSF